VRQQIVQRTRVSASEGSPGIRRGQGFFFEVSASNAEWLAVLDDRQLHPIHWQPRLDAPY